MYPSRSGIAAPKLEIPSGFLQFNDVRDCRRKPVPIAGLPFELPSPQPRQRIELGAAVVRAGLPLGGNPAFLLELVQSGIEGTVADLENVCGNLLQALADGKAIERLERENFQ